MQNIFKHRSIIIGIVIFIIAFIAYAFYINSSKQPSSGVTKQAVTQPLTTNAAAGPGQEFVSQLLAIQNINLNLDFFNDSVFLGLQDFSHELTPQPAGRDNPFSPINISQLSGTAAAAPSTPGSLTGSTFQNNTGAVAGTPAGVGTLKAGTAAGTGAKKPAGTLPPRPGAGTGAATGTGTKTPLFKNTTAN